MNGQGIFVWELSHISSPLSSHLRSFPNMKWAAVKAGDGVTSWSQFNPSLVSELKRASYTPVAWTYVYGLDPVSEAQVALNAVHQGAEALVIEAEVEYAGYNTRNQRVGNPRSAQASIFMETLRHSLGGNFPIFLTSFATMGAYPAFPWENFLHSATGVMPQCYSAAYTPGTLMGQVQNSRQTFSSLAKEFWPVAPAWGSVRMSELDQFIQEEEKADPGYSFWDLDSLTEAAYNALRAPLPKPPTLEARVNTLDHDVSILADLTLRTQKASLGPEEIQELVNMGAKP